MCNRKLVKKNSDDPKAFLRTVKQMLPGKSTSTTVNVNIDGKLCADRKIMSDAFNNFSVVQLTVSSRTLGLLKVLVVFEQKIF